MTRWNCGSPCRALAAGFATWLACATAAEAQPGPWHQGTTGPTARCCMGGATDGASIYIFGGADSGGVVLKELWRWNPAAETWTPLADMPTTKQDIQGAYWNGRIYVPGGFNGGTFFTENAIYDIASNQWLFGTPLPVPSAGAATAAHNDRIYVFGGNPGPSNRTRIYDVLSNSWSVAAGMPVGLANGRAITVGTFAYYVGGGAVGNPTNAVYRYDLVANTWTTMASLQTGREREELMANPVSGKIYAINGGDGLFGVPIAQTVEIYDGGSNTWTYGQPTLTTTSGPAGGLIPGPGGKFVIMGGFSFPSYFNDTQVSTNTTPVEVIDFSVR